MIDGGMLSITSMATEDMASQGSFQPAPEMASDELLSDIVPVDPQLSIPESEQTYLNALDLNMIWSEDASEALPIPPNIFETGPGVFENKPDVLDKETGLSTNHPDYSIFHDPNNLTRADQGDMTMLTDNEFTFDQTHVPIYGFNDSDHTNQGDMLQSPDDGLPGNQTYAPFQDSDNFNHVDQADMTESMNDDFMNDKIQAPYFVNPPFMNLDHTHPLDNPEWLNSVINGPQDFEAGYGLRQGIRQQVLNRMGPAWEDQDDSGNYDPNQKDLPTSAMPVKRKRIVPSSACKKGENNGPESKRRGTMHTRLARLTGYQTSVSFSVDPQKLKEIIDNCSVRLPDKWPEVPYNSLEESELLSPTSGQVYALRERRLRGTSLELDVDLRNHPAGRGCKACYESGQECPLREPEAQYPCTYCVEDDCVCQLLVPPAKKQSCERCKSKRRQCSYLKDEDHSQPCRACQVDGMSCYAGSADDPSRARIGHDGRPAALILEDVLKTRPFLKCTSCRRSNTSCSLKTYEDQPPCKSCKIKGVPCTFERVKAAKPDAAARGRNPLSTSNNFAQAVSAKKSTTVAKWRKEELSPTKPDAIVIRTKLAHPLSFNHPEPRDLKTCHWCTIPTYGLVGYGERQVTVLEWVNERGYQEISGGHTDDDLETSRMCSDCTFQRVLITICPDHQIVRLEGAHSQKWSDLLIGLDRCRESSKIQEYYSKICSICPAKAEYMCCTPQEGCLPSNISRHGCGLRLCKKCVKYLKSPLFGGTIHKMVSGLALVADDINLFPEGLRADAHLLRYDSQMMKQVLA